MGTWAKSNFALTEFERICWREMKVQCRFFLLTQKHSGVYIAHASRTSSSES